MLASGWRLQLFLLFSLWAGPTLEISGAEFEIVWDSVFGGTGDDSLRSAVRAEGGYLLGGVSRSPKDGTKTADLIGFSDFWVVKTDEQGHKLWDRAYGTAGAYSDLATIQSAGAGEYLLGGITDGPPWAPGTLPWLVQIDERGDVLWERQVTGTALDRIAKIEPTEAGYFLAGAYGSVVIRTDVFGRKIWVRSLGRSWEDTLRGVAATPDGGCLVGLSTMTQLPDFSFGFGSWDCWVIKLDADGGEEWQQFYGDSGAQFSNSIVPDPAGNFYLLGQWGFPFEAWLVKIDTTGKKLWDIKLGEGADTVATCIKATTDGGCLIGGYVVTMGPHGTVFLGPVLYKTSADGTHEWTFREESSDQLNSIEFAPDGDIILAGSTVGDLSKFHYRVRKLHVNNAPVGSPRIYLDGQQRSLVYSATNQAVLEIKSSIANAAIHFTLDGSEPVADSPVYTTPLTLTNDSKIRAAILNPTPLLGGPVKLSVFHGYKLLVRPNGAGQINVAPDSPGYFPGDPIQAIAIPKPGWSFSNWEGYLAGRTDNPLTFAIVFDQEIGAKFTTTLSLEANPLEGTIRPVPNVLNPAYGTALQFVAIPTNGFYFSRWLGTVEGTNNPAFLQITDANPVVRAEFAPLGDNAVSFVAVPNGDGKITQTPNGSVFTIGQEILLTATPNAGGSFLGWLGLSNRVESSELKVTLATNTVVIAIFSGGDTSMFGDIVQLTNPTVTTNSFAFGISADSTNSIAVESSVDLKQWQKVTNAAPQIVVERAGHHRFFRTAKTR